MRKLVCTIILLTGYFFAVADPGYNISVSPSATICEGGTITLTATGAPSAATFQWTKSNSDIPGATSSTFTLTNVTTTDGAAYSVVVTSNGNTIHYDTVTIVVNVKPVASFTNVGNNPCGSVSFTNTSTGSGLSYLWSFDDTNSGSNNSSNQTNPLHQFVGTPGNGTQSFNVKLTVTNSFGCKDSITQIVSTKQLPDASIQDYTSTTPFTNCGGTTSTFHLVIDNTSSTTATNTLYHIDWGDGTQYTNSNLPSTGTSHDYTTLGYFTLTITVTGQNGCSSTKTYSIYNGSNPQVPFSNPGSSTEQCVPFTYTLPILPTNNPPGTIYIISKNDGTANDTLTQPLPASYSHTFLGTSCGATGGITPNTFKINIRAENPCGFSDLTIQPITTSTRPSAKFTSTDTVICVNQIINLANTSINGVTVNNSGNCIYTNRTNWTISPSTGWTITSGSLGDLNPTNNPSTWGSANLNVKFTSTGQYTITLIVRGPNTNCGNDTITRTICVNPQPISLFTIDNSQGCTPVSVATTNNSNTPICGTNTYSWSVTYLNNQSCTPNSANYSPTGIQTTFQPSYQFINPGVYTISLVTRNSDGACVSTTTTQQVTVKTKPNATIAAISNICQNQSVTPIATVNDCYSSTTATYSWTFANGSPSTSTSQSPGSIIYNSAGLRTISLDVTNECGVTNATRTFTVNPKPDLTIPANQTFCAGNATGTLNFSSSLPGTSFTWTNNNTAIGLPLNGSGNIGSFTTTNSTNAPVTANIKVTATNSNGCSDTASFTITVNPKPTVNQPSNQTICNGAPTTAINFGGSAITGTVYEWTNDNTSIGLAASGTGDIASFVATNTGNSSVTATITVTPKITNGITCSGISRTFTITVNPTPTVNQPTDKEFCNGVSTTAITFNGSNVSGTTYTWTNNNTAIGLGAGPTTGNISSFTATNSGTTPISGIITVTPKANGCSGSSKTFTIIINPAAAVQFSDANQTICSGGTSSAVTLSSTTTGATIAWTTTQPTGISGITQTNGTTTIPTQTLINSTTAPITVNYLATATTSGTTSCSGAQFTYSIIVNPVPAISNTTETVCSGVTFTVSPSGVPTGTTYTWVAPTGTGFTGGTAGNNQASVTGTLNNNTNTTHTALYTITPKSGNCPGNNFTVNVNVNPKPFVEPINITICSGETFNITPTDGLPSSATIIPPGTTYTWTVPTGTGFTGGSAQATGVNSIGQTLTNTTNNTVTATYTVTPSSGATGSCAGPSFIVTVTVKPKPSISNAVASICTEGTFTITPTNSSPDIVPSGTVYSWNTPVITGGLTGGSSGLNQTSMSGTLTNSGNNSETATYTVTPVANGCTGNDFTVTVTVNPKPVINNQSAAICSGATFSITPSGVPSGTVYTWATPTGTGFTGGSAQITGTSTISQTLTNTTNAPVTATYNVNPTSGTCGGTPFQAIVTVNPSATVQFSLGDQTICSGSATSLVNLSSNTSGVTFSWTSTANGVTGVAPSGMDNIPAQTLNNSSNAPITVTYSASASTGGTLACTGVAATYSIIVNPTPNVTANPTSQTICSGTATNIALSSNIVNANFTWTVSTNSNGATVGTGNVIAQTLTNSSTADQTATYTITPTYTNNSVTCTGTPINVDVTVKPTPDVTISPAPQTICSGNSSTAVILSSAVSGAVFDWTANVPVGITGVAPNQNNTITIPAMNLVNATNTPLTVTFTITPKTSGGGACSGSNVTYTITVNPAPNVSFNPTAETICSGNVTTAVTLSSTTAGATFNWTATANGAGGVTPSTGTGNIPSQTLTNTTNAPISVIFTATANTSGSTTCSGTPDDYTIVVNPIPDVTATPTSQTICSNTTTSIALSSAVGGTNFRWVVSNNPNISGALIGNGINIAQTLINNSSTPQDITYTITPTYSNAGKDCEGLPVTVTITVNPNATVTNSQMDQTICSNTSSAVVTFTTSTATGSTTFGWTGTTANGITGFTANGNGNLPTMTLVNPNNTQGSVVYTVTPTYTNNAVACAGTNATYTIFVNPTPNVILPAVQTICSGSTSNNVPLNSNVTGTTFNWTAVASSSSVTGFTASATGVTSIAPQTINNSASSVETVTYTVTPITNSCTGASLSYVININPTPGITLPPNQTICSGATSSLVNLTSDVAGATFSWTAIPSSGNITGYTPAASNVTTIPVQTIFNSGTAPGTVIYSITPITSGSTACPGTAVPYTITINPSPIVDFSIADQTICSGGSSTPVNITSTTPNAVISWTSNANGAGGVTATGSNNIPTQTLMNTTNAPITVTYTASATTNDAAACSGPTKLYRITVNPLPDVTATPSSASICTNTATNISLNSFVPGATFGWTVAVTGGITGALNGTGNSIVQTLVNNGVNPETATYTITPSYSNNGTVCTGNPITVVIVVNPVASITNNPLSQTICTNTATTPVTWTSFTTGTTYAWTASSANGITGFPLTGTGDLPAMTLVNAAGTQGTVTVLVTSTANLCSGPPTPYIITVNPDAKANMNIIEDSACAAFVIDNVNGVKPVLYPSQNSSYNWYADDVFYGSSPNSNPGYTLINAGDSVTIKMVAISLYGCKNDSTEHKFYTIPRPITEFTASDTVGCGPLNVLFTNTTPNISWFSYFWDFGNGQTFTGAQPGTIVFQSNPNYGDTTYNVTLTAFTRCDTVKFIRNVRVKSKPKALFFPNTTYGCSPLPVLFTNTTLGLNVTYTWDFGDGSATVNTNNTSPVSHTYHTAQQDTFHVKLIATNECGSDTATYAIVVAARNLNLNFTVNGNEITGCAPHTVRFINTSTGATNFVWSFGDGNIRSTTNNNDTITHTYTATGIFVATVRASNGCTDTTATITIQVFRKPIPDFAVNPLPACIGDTLQFTNQTDTATNILWQFGNGVTSQLSNPQYAYTTAGTYDVKLIAVRQYGPGNACSDSITKTITVVASLPGSFSVSDSVSPCVPFTVTFTNNSLPSALTTWNFGDGGVDTGDIVSHTFTQVGVYTVTMTANDIGGCKYITTKQIIVNGPTGSFVYDNGFICGAAPVRFETVATGTDSVQWNFGDGTIVTTTNRIVYHVYNQPGNYLPSVKLLAGGGACSRLLQGTDTIKVDYIKAGFQSSQVKSCGITNVSFSDTSRSYFGIQTWQWNFGDGNNSNIQSPAHTYTSTNTWNVQLIVTGVSGCADTINSPLLIKVDNKPISSIIAPGTGCVNQPVTYNSSVVSTDPVTYYNWSFSNGATANAPNFDNNYAAAGVYTAQLITGTSFGCYDTTTHSITINPSPIVRTNPNMQICRGQSAQLLATGGLTYDWAPFTGLSCTTCANPVASPTTTTQYVVTGYNSYGCAGRDTVLITVPQPIHVVATSNTVLCVGSSVQLNSSGATTYEWSPSTALSCTTCAAPVASPTVTTIYRVIGKDAYNCFQDTAYVTVGVGDYPVVNVGPDKVLSTGTQLTLAPTATNGPIAIWTWSPSTDLSCAGCASPIATAKKDICYTVTATNFFGCSGKDTMCIKVFCESSQLFIPNAFTPDGDGVNDKLVVRAQGVKIVKSFRIFNRWGQLVFEKANFIPNADTYGWDGKVNGVAAPPDVYVYTCEVVCEDDTPYTYKGNVAIIK